MATYQPPSNTSASITSGTLQAANVNRQFWICSNDSTSKLYLLFGAGTASASNYTYVVPAGGTFEMVSNQITGPPLTYTGVIVGVWAAANGSAGCTEVT